MQLNTSGPLYLDKDMLMESFTPQGVDKIEITCVNLKLKVPNKYTLKKDSVISST